MLQSKNGTRISWTDDFYPELLNFTGKHRCVMIQNQNVSPYDLIGMIVKTSGTYMNLDDSSEITIDEALPVVELTGYEYEKSSFGVISDVETSNRKYKIGNMIFSSDAKCTPRVVVNSVGEGALWIVNTNGKCKNGDFITSSSVPGFGMRQKSTFLRNYTIAKITCDCSFDLDSKIYKCHEFVFKGRIYRKAFVGCTYKF